MLGEGVDLAEGVVVAALLGQLGRLLVDLVIVRLGELFVLSVVLLLERSDLGHSGGARLGRHLERELGLGLELDEPLELRVGGDGALQLVHERREIPGRLLRFLFVRGAGGGFPQPLLSLGAPARAAGVGRGPGSVAACRGADFGRAGGGVGAAGSVFAAAWGGPAATGRGGTGGGEGVRPTGRAAGLGGADATGRGAAGRAARSSS